MGEAIQLSVVIPAYNEAENIASTLREVFAYLERQPFVSEVLVVDDGSDDRTTELVDSLNGQYPHLRLVRNPANRGKGFAVRRGMQEGRGRYALFMDADNSVSIRELGPFLARLEAGDDVIIASRYVAGAKVEPPQPKYRILMGKFYHCLCQLLLVAGVSDYNCGFKLYNERARVMLFHLQRMDDWSFDAELLYLARQHRLRVAELPVRWRYTGTSTVKPIQDSLKSLVSLMRIRWNAIKGVYG